jgi:site-specific DNA-adenine methylase
MFNAMTNRMKVYRINTVNEDLVQFSHVIESSVRAVADAVAEMRNSKDPQRFTQYASKFTVLRMSEIP